MGVEVLLARFPFTFTHAGVGREHSDVHVHARPLPAPEKKMDLLASLARENSWLASLARLARHASHARTPLRAPLPIPQFASFQQREKLA